MPTMPPHRCSSCGQLVTGACLACRRTRDTRRPTASQRGYLLPAWRTLRASKLALDPCCSVCGGPATDVDHLRRVSGPDDPLFWQFANLDSKCHACHSRKTAITDSAFANRR